jgi:hypothetical protein
MIPKTPDAEHFLQIGFVFSGHDIIILTRMCQTVLPELFSGAKLREWREENCDIGYSPFFLDIHQNIEKREEKRSRPNSWYCALRAESLSCGHSLLSYLVNTPFYLPRKTKFGCRPSSIEFDVDSLKEYIGEGREIVEMMDVVIELIRMKNELNEYCRHINGSYKLIMDYFAWYYVRRGNILLTSLSSAGIPRGVIASFWFAILNLDEIGSDRVVDQLIARYDSYVSKVAEMRVLSWAAANPMVAKSLLGILETMSSALQLGYGRRLRVFLEAIAVIAAFDTERNRRDGVSEWQAFFDFLIVGLDRGAIIRSYLVWKESLMNAGVSMLFFGSLDQRDHELLLAGFAGLLVDDPQLHTALQLYSPPLQSADGLSQSMYVRVPPTRVAMCRGVREG